MTKFLHISIALLLGFLLVFAGCAKKKKVAKRGQATIQEAQDFSAEDLDSIQLDALSGEDIPLSDVPMDMSQQEFVDPDPAIFENVLFDYDSSILKEEVLPILARIGAWLQENMDIHAMIEGHADERGTNEYNLALGEQRALAVRRYLVSLGIDPDRLHTISYGEERPIIVGDDEQSYAENRRVEFKVST